jgi:hypothetical protein
MEEVMSLGANTTWAPRRPPEAASVEASKRVQIAGFALRTAFVVLLAVATLRISLPQSETIWTVYDSPGDLIRLLLGVVACAWITFQVFTAPLDLHANRTWLYLGVTAVPFVLVCIVYVW